MDIRKLNLNNEQGFIKIFSYDKWDHRFFGVNEIEAEVMDPQQKLVLDCVHMAMEDGGIVRRDLEKTRTGVYIGRLLSCHTQKV